MKIFITTFIFCLLSIPLLSQENNLSQQEIQTKLDSIKKEGNLLYSYEIASWNSTDEIRNNNKLKNEFGGYLTYQVNDTIKTAILNIKKDKIIAEFCYLNSDKKPVKERIKTRNLNDTEVTLNNLRQNLIYQLSDSKYEVTVPENFSLNIISIADGDKFKNYLVTASKDASIIPFGNDYLFITNSLGQIIDWKKFHSKLIPTYSSNNRNELTASTHSHLKTNPYISATDICTFKLYAPFFAKLDQFSVYSPALKTYFTYNYKKDTLVVTDKL